MMAPLDALTITLDRLDQADVAAAFDKARVRRASAMRLTIGEQLRPDAEFVRLVVEALASVPSLKHLAIRHPRLVTRFLASSIALSAPTVAVIAEVEAAQSSRTTAAFPVRTTPTAPAERSRVLVVDLDEGGHALDEALERARTGGITHLVIALGGARPLEASVRDALVDGLPTIASLRVLALAHASAAVGFLASTITLRVPHVRVRSFTTREEAEHAMNER